MLRKLLLKDFSCKSQQHRAAVFSTLLQQRQKDCTPRTSSKNTLKTLAGASDQKQCDCTMKNAQNCVTNTFQQNLLVCQTHSRANIRLLSGYFIKLKQPEQHKQSSRFDKDEHYEKVRSQNFGPVPLSQSDVREDYFGLPSREFAKRDFAEFGGLKYYQLPIIHVVAKYNNTFVTISDHTQKKVYCAESCGTSGFKNAKKKTTYAAEMVGKAAAEKAILKGCPEHARVKVKGPGYGREGAMRGITMGGMKIVSFTDITPIFTGRLPQRPRAIRRI